MDLPTDVAGQPPVEPADASIRAVQGGEAPARPLAGVRVLALEQAVAGPLCSRHLGDLGAEVIKVERPGDGDFARGYDTAVNGLSSYFVWLNRGKRSLTLDIKHGEAPQILHRLLSSTDVLVQNLGPGAIDRLGLDPASVRSRYPRMIFCCISGYGRGGPYEHRKAFDLLLQGETGVIATTGTPEYPAKVGLSVGDIGAGVYGAMATVAALYQRRTTGHGTLVETSLFDALAEWMGYPAAFTHYNGTAPARAGVRHATVVPYGSYRCGDGSSILLAVQTDGQWERFCRDVCEHPEWQLDPQFRTSSERRLNREVLETAIEVAFARHPRDEIARRLHRADVPYGEVREVADFLEHPQLAERGRWREVDSTSGPIRAIVPPMDFDGVDPRMDRVPGVGEDTDAILGELGYDRASIDRLRNDGAI